MDFLIQTAWYSIELHGHAIAFHGTPRYSMEFHGIPWNSINTSWNSMELHGIPWNSMEVPWNSMDFHRFPWNSMDFHRFPWISMEFHGGISHGGWMLYSWILLLGDHFAYSHLVWWQAAILLRGISYFSLLGVKTYMCSTSWLQNMYCKILFKIQMSTYAKCFWCLPVNQETFCTLVSVRSFVVSDKFALWSRKDATSYHKLHIIF